MDALGLLLLIPLLFGLGLLLLNIITSIWCYKDSLAKGNSKEYGLIVLFGTLFFSGCWLYYLFNHSK